MTAHQVPIEEVGLRALSDYDDLFALNTPSPAASVVRPDLQVVR